MLDGREEVCREFPIPHFHNKWAAAANSSEGGETLPDYLIDVEAQMLGHLSLSF